ncbi:hypothetical protein [Labilithrix luteola]|nr:hypothetical protein [Labilithrix luteola]
MSLEALWPKVPDAVRALAEEWRAAGKEPPASVRVFQEQSVDDVIDALSSASSFEEFLQSDDTNPGASVWVALAVARLKLPLSRPVPDDIDGGDFLEGDVRDANSFDHSGEGCAVVAGSLDVRRLRVTDSCSFVVAGDLKARIVRVTGVVIVTGDVTCDLLQVLGSGGIFWVDGTCRTKVLDNPNHFHLAAKIDAACNVQTLDDAALSAKLAELDIGQDIGAMVRGPR